MLIQFRRHLCRRAVSERSWLEGPSRRWNALAERIFHALVWPGDMAVIVIDWLLMTNTNYRAKCVTA
jgi:hypothetical protein